MIQIAYAYAIGYQFSQIPDFIRVSQSPNQNFSFVDVYVDLKTQKLKVFEIVKLLNSISSHNQLHGYEPLFWIILEP